VLRYLISSLDSSEFRIKKFDISLKKNLLPNDYDIVDFEGFDYENGTENFIIPNIVHLVYLGLSEINFYQSINIYSIYLNHKPDFIFFHCDLCNFTGKYWTQINSVRNLRRRIVLNKISSFKTIFGQKYHFIQHKSDVIRILALQTFGGIYLDNDVFVVNSLDKYRKYEFVAGIDNEEARSLGSMVLLANKNSRLLKAQFDSYRTNYSQKWYWNAGNSLDDLNI
jgi:hypothetical protein